MSTGWRFFMPLRRNDGSEIKPATFEEQVAIHGVPASGAVIGMTKKVYFGFEQRQPVEVGGRGERNVLADLQMYFKK